MKDYKITNYRRANGVTIYTLLKNDKIIASSSNLNCILDSRKEIEDLKKSRQFYIKAFENEKLKNKILKNKIK